MTGLVCEKCARLNRLETGRDIVKLAQHEPRKDAWRSIDAILDQVTLIRRAAP